MFTLAHIGGGIKRGLHLDHEIAELLLNWKIFPDIMFAISVRKGFCNPNDDPPLPTPIYGPPTPMYGPLILIFVLIFLCY